MADTDLQLLPERRTKISVHVPGENRAINTAVVFVILVSLLYAGAIFYKNSIISSIESLDSQLQKLENSRDKTTEEKLITLHKRFQVTNDLLNAHLFWSGAFTKIQELIQPQVEFKNLSGSLSEKKFSFKAEAGNYETVAKQIASFRNSSDITNISLEKVNSLPNGRVEFNMTLNFNPDKLLKTSGENPTQ